MWSLTRERRVRGGHGVGRVVEIVGIAGRESSILARGVGIVLVAGVGGSS